MNRKIGYISSILAFLIALISIIPISPENNLKISFNIFSIDNSEYYIWGTIENGISSLNSMNMNFPENLMAIFLWILIIFIGISSIITALSNTKSNNIFKLYSLNILISTFLITVYTIIVFTLLDWNDFLFIFSILGLGYYLILVILLLNILSLHFFKKSDYL
ncbi:MAG: hypothetical protein JXA99_07150 [Candidatus Lokiarchaeota archaeon]|nr:hypothetical protein [Candidatus Lokiarchaeota archaeon]